MEATAGFEQRSHIVWALQVTLVVKNPPASAGDIRDAGSILGSGRSAGGGAWQPTPAFLPRESHGQRSLAGYGPRGRKELDTIEETQHTCTAHSLTWVLTERRCH